ncbi:MULTISPECIES: class I SAM-dependent methyltransferase [unclassified Pseudoalteromonas]|uniref:class I SAM-dependent methyltransferase n=1 Tax=unclassified Pseudoalteromonas TaxID=194690 RepID=UPI000CF6E9EB|nr:MULTISPECIES: class I SAM-dependent methyltransferase [unclassified Pseudoalteromonas]
MKQWEDFWHQTSMVSSFGLSGQQYGYPKAIEEFWCAKAATYDDGDTLLDLACGRGALALLLADNAQQSHKPLDIHATDAVAIDMTSVAAEYEAYKRITWNLGCDIANLAYAQGSFNRLVSQFGVEYATLNKPLLDSLIGLLAPAGSADFIIHSASSAISADSIQGIKAIERVFHSGIFLKVYQELTSSGARQSLAEEVQNLFNNLAKDSLMKSWLDDICASFLRIIDAPAERTIVLLDRLATNLEQTVTRLQQQLSVAHSVEKLEALLQPYSGVVEYTIERVVVDGSEFGLHLHLGKKP